MKLTLLGFEQQSFLAVRVSAKDKAVDAAHAVPLGADYNLFFSLELRKGKRSVCFSESDKHHRGSQSKFSILRQTVDLCIFITSGGQN